ncbi:MAG: hypothetical protein KF778_12715 [Rhodocyclaceae bacterium]|nr:hypothetical protein [Rhodocyclaceae bacterium]
MKRATSLLQAVLASDNLARAWETGRFNRGAPALIWRKCIEDFPDYARAHWAAQASAVGKGQYWPQAVRRVEIPRARWRPTAASISTVTDRVVQQAIAQVGAHLLFDPTSPSRVSARPGRNAHQAIRQVQAIAARTGAASR